MLVALQAITVIVLQIVSAQRKRLQQPGSFPHPQMREVCVGENKLEIYNYGRDLYDAMLAAIDAAEESIYLETYIWKDDAVGQAFKEHLTRKADQGVEVYVIFDSFGNTVVPRKFKVFPPNIHVLPFQAIRRPWHLFDLRRYALEHRKLLVVDGSTSFIGGYNLGSLYATPGEIHTCAFRVQQQPIWPARSSTFGIYICPNRCTLRGIIRVASIH